MEIIKVNSRSAGSKTRSTQPQQAEPRTNAPSGYLSGSPLTQLGIAGPPGTGGLASQNPMFGLPQDPGSGSSPGLTGFLGRQPLSGLNEFRMPPPMPYEDVLNATQDQAAREAANISPPVDPNAEIAVIDSFHSFGQPSHGQQVSNVLNSFTDSHSADIQHFENSSHYGLPIGLLLAPGDASPSERLDAFLEHGAAGFLERTNAHLSNIASDPNSNIRTINQSEGSNPIHQFESLRRISTQTGENGELQLSDAGRVVFEALGLEPNTEPETLRAFVQRGTERAQEVYSSSDRVSAALTRHEELSQTLSEQGISYVVSAGNQGQIARDYLQAGIPLAETVDDNLLSNPHNITVGALDDAGTPDPRDDRMASFTSADPEVDFLASGVSVNTGAGLTNSGTSFSAPRVAGRLDALREQNPTLSQDALLSLLRESHAQAAPYSTISTVR